MAHELTPAQHAAVFERDRTLLVSAAAGSGKTSVLTERIVRAVTDEENPIDITRLLIVTFTVDAAGEMRHRISKKLNEKLAERPDSKHILHQLMLLGSAHISTIDAFYLELVKANFEAAGISPTVRLADEGELMTLRRELMNAVVDKMYAEEPEFYRVADLLTTVKEESAVTEKLLDIVAKLQSFPAGAAALLQSAEDAEALAEKPYEGRIGEAVRCRLLRTVKEGCALFENAITLLANEEETVKLTRRYLAYFTEWQTRLAALADALESGSADEVAALFKLPFETKLTGGAYPYRSPAFLHAAGLCNMYRDLFKKTAEKWGAFDRREIAAGCYGSAKLLRLLYRAVSAFEADYGAAKSEREVAEFHDIARAAYRLLVDENGNPTPLAATVADSYDAIYIDEYQDVSAMQDATFRAISKPCNRFMVGDIKQSIYRFRSADPAVFAAYRKTFPDLTAAGDGDAATIFMSDCFRCDENVIRFSNAVSGYLFGKSRESIGYRPDDDLVFRKALPTPDYRSPKCQVMWLEGAGKNKDAETEEAEEEASPAEIRMVAAEIRRILKEETKADGKPYTFADIAVLCRSKKSLAILAELLKSAGIPCDDSGKRNFFENPEVLCMFSLLSVIDNPLRDVYLAGVLRSPFFGFTLSDLVAIRRSGEKSDSLYEALLTTAKESHVLGRRAAAFLSKLSNYRKKATELSVDKLLRYLYRDTAVLSFSSGEEAAGADRRANLLRLYEYARKFEAGGYKGLYRFVNYVEDIMRNNTELKTPGSGADVVKLTTIHKSKGLEFPVCFIVGCGTYFNTADQRESFVLDDTLGAALRLPNAGAFSRAETFPRAAVVAEIDRKAREEEMRILYVAMTRAVERLYLTGKSRGKISKLADMAALRSSDMTDLFAIDGNCYLDWVMSALSGKEYGDYCELRVLSEEEIGDILPTTATTDTIEVTADADFAATLRERAAFTYPYKHLTRLPAKLSVSRLAPTVLDVYDNADAATPADLAPPDADKLLAGFEQVPLFDALNRTPDPAAAGTATHEFLQFCHFENAEKTGVENELFSLIEAKFLPSEYRDIIRMDELTAFFKSDFFAMLKRATDVHRETRFHIFLPAADFTADEAFRSAIAEEKLLIQGVIDLFFTDEKGNLVLCDYKTDRLSPYELSHPEAAARTLFARHGEQLRYYGEALARLCGRYPDKTLIYSLPLGAALEAPV